MLTKISYGFKEIANLLIDQTFPDRHSLIRSKYKAFQLELRQNSYRSRLGCYNMVNKSIQLSGLSTECRSDIIITFLHELSHHIETVNTGKSGHQKAFYDIHIKLLKKAIDLGLINTEHIVNNQTSDAGNVKKLAKLLGNYKRQGDDRIENYIDTSFLLFLLDKPKINEILKIKCPIEEKQLLKNNGYTWNGTEYVWVKTICDKTELDKERKFLENNGFRNIKISKVSYYAKYVYLCVSGDTYNNKDLLSSLKFVYDVKRKIWRKQILVTYKPTIEISKLRTIRSIRVFYEF